jgi:hypothetical protein
MCQNACNQRWTALPKKTVFSLTLAKNEEDIIEVFVRYNLKAVDRMYIADNLSTDGTRAILESLVREGLPVRILDDRNPAHEQSKKTTAIYREIAATEDFDAIVFIDADEFLDAPEGWLDDFEPGMVGELTRSRFLFPRHVVPGQAPVAAMQEMMGAPESSKSFLMHDKRSANEVRIGEGNHHIYRSGRAVPKTGASANIRHYPLRTAEQYVRKNLLGWLSMQAKDYAASQGDSPIAAHWRREFEYILSRDAIITHEMAVQRLRGKDDARVKGGVTLNPIDLPAEQYAHLQTRRSLVTQMARDMQNLTRELATAKAAAAQLVARDPSQAGAV